MDEIKYAVYIIIIEDDESGATLENLSLSVEDIFLVSCDQTYDRARDTFDDLVYEGRNFG